MMTLGYRDLALGYLILAEGLLLGLVGGMAGVVTSSLWLQWQRYTLGNEGLTLSFVPGGEVLFNGLVLSLVLGLLAGLFPAWMATGQSIVKSLRDG